MKISCFYTLIFLGYSSPCQSFLSSVNKKNAIVDRAHIKLSLKSISNEASCEKVQNKSRINPDSSSIFTSIALACTIAATTLFQDPHIASAAPSQNLDNEKEKIVKGYKRLDYLLTNWDKETTFCNRNDNPYNGCERSPEKVMEYLGKDMVILFHK